MSVTFSQSGDSVAVNDFVEITATIDAPTVVNPFLDGELTGKFGADFRETDVIGYCDSEDGSVYKIRFLATIAGRYDFAVAYTQSDGQRSGLFAGTFTAHGEEKNGLLRVSKENRDYFERDGKPFFWNSTTAYSIAGFDRETIVQILDRFKRFDVNRIRATLYGPRVESGAAWDEPTVVPTENFRFLFAPWPAANPDSVAEPGFDVSRFDLARWRHYEFLLAEAQKRGILVETMFYLDGARPGGDPFGRKENTGDNPDELRYYKYAAARLAAFANVVWDVTNEYQLFRTVESTEKLGAYLRSQDPYRHLISVHGHGDFPFRTSDWADYAIFQIWDENGGGETMLQKRAAQHATGRVIPQVNEEYGYEDHYPKGWGEGRVAPSRDADNRRRIAWGVTMAACHQTTGERADTVGGGGWVNGRGTDDMILLMYHRYLKQFFEAIPVGWQNLRPQNELVSLNGALCMTDNANRCYVVYLSQGGGAFEIAVAPGDYKASWFNPRTGQSTPIAETVNRTMNKMAAPDADDWVLLLLLESNA